MTEPRYQDDAGSSERLRELMHRYSLGSQRFRAVVGRSLRMPESDVAALAYLSLGRSLTPGQLADILGLTSGGTTALLQRLEPRDFIARADNPDDHRSTLLSLTDTTASELGESYRPLVEELNKLIQKLSDEQRAVLAAFLTAATDRTAEATERLRHELMARERKLKAPPHPGLWA